MDLGAKGALGWLALGGLVALCCGLPLVLAAGLALGSAGYLLGGVLVAVLGGLAGVVMAIFYLGRRARRQDAGGAEDVGADLLLKIETMRKGGR